MHLPRMHDSGNIMFALSLPPCAFLETPKEIELLNITNSGKPERVCKTIVHLILLKSEVTFISLLFSTHSGNQ